MRLFPQAVRPKHLRYASVNPRRAGVNSNRKLERDFFKARQHRRDPLMDRAATHPEAFRLSIASPLSREQRFALDSACRSAQGNSLDDLRIARFANAERDILAAQKWDIFKSRQQTSLLRYRRDGIVPALGFFTPRPRGPLCRPEAGAPSRPRAPRASGMRGGPAHHPAQLRYPRTTGEPQGRMAPGFPLDLRMKIRYRNQLGPDTVQLAKLLRLPDASGAPPTASDAGVVRRCLP